MKKYLGFTLAELMIAMLVLGILLAITMPLMAKRQVNKNKIFIKKAYYATTEVISELINDESIYAGLDGYCPETGATGYVGFDCLPASTTPNANYYGKLAYQFANKLNIVESISLDGTYTGLTQSYNNDCSSYMALDTSYCYTFNTTDGIHWMFPGMKSFTKGDTTTPYTIGIDVNGIGIGDDCFQGSSKTKCSGKTNGFDQFRIKIYYDGRMEIPSTETWAIDAIQIGSSLTGK